MGGLVLDGAQGLWEGDSCSFQEWVGGLAYSPIANYQIGPFLSVNGVGGTCTWSLLLSGSVERKVGPKLGPESPSILKSAATLLWLDYHYL